MSELIQPDECPCCFASLDSAKCLNDRAKPSVGDVTVCFECGELMTFGERLILCRAEEKDLDSLDSENKAILMRAQRLIRQSKTL